ncbi:DUF445 family protein [Peribacillus sp. FSL R5-0717]|uniref:DUF445 family protein n=1 Tax=Peribacillus sp. FSL R5-0717 TaxID=2975308 RepID=UPI0030F888A5
MASLIYWLSECYSDRISQSILWEAPGLIPKRQDELAKQLGKLVVDHLITPGSIQSKVINDASIQNMKIFVQAEVKKALSTQKVLLNCLINWE